MANTGKQYEKLAQMVFSHINNANREGLETIIVQHDVVLQGKITKHQIDVYWEFKVGDITHKVAVQAKDLSRKVSKPQMQTFESVINDLPGIIGIFVSKHGFQKGAQDIAIANNIRTYELRSPVDSDWDGYIKTMVFKMHLLIPVCENFKTVLDKEWLIENKISIEEAVRFRVDTTQDCYVIRSSGEKKTVFDIISDTCKKIGTNIQKGAILYDDDTFIEFSSGERFKIKGFQGDFGNRELFHEFTVDGGNMVDLILKDVVSGEGRMFNTHDLRHQFANIESLY